MAVTCCEYEVPTVPDGSVVVVIAKAAGAVTVMLNAALLDALLESTVVMVNRNVLADVGAPEITAVDGFRLKPLGREPEVTLHV